MHGRIDGLITKELHSPMIILMARAELTSCFYLFNKFCCSNKRLLILVVNTEDRSGSKMKIDKVAFVTISSLLQFGKGKNKMSVQPLPSKLSLENGALL